MSGLYMIGSDIYRSFGSLEKVDGYKRARGGSSDSIHHTAPDPRDQARDTPTPRHCFIGGRVKFKMHGQLRGEGLVR